MSDVVEQGTGAKAKEISKWSQVVAAVWIAGWSSYAFLSGKSLDMGDIMLSGIGIAATFTPVYLSIILDKIKDMRLGK